MVTSHGLNQQPGAQVRSRHCVLQCFKADEIKFAGFVKLELYHGHVWDVFSPAIQPTWPGLPRYKAEAKLAFI